MAPSKDAMPPPKGLEISQAAPDLWKIEDISGKGKGVIALKSITPGTLLISEAPIFTTEIITALSTADSDIAKHLRTLPKDKQRAFLSLHNNFPGQKGPLTNILKSNGYPLGAGSEVGGIFENISRINHSCLPNAVHNWNPLLEQETVYVVRPIAEDEEITLSYHSGGPSHARKSLLKENFGFDCTCALCSSSPSALKKSDENLILAASLDASIGDSETVRYSPNKVLKSCKSLLAIYEEEGIKDDRLSRAYYDLFQICAMHSDAARASWWARRYVEVKSCSAGRDSVDLLEMKPFVKKPGRFESWGVTGMWKSKSEEVPKERDGVEFERWLWRE
ncbi:hypothetical protein BJ875DRAFT_462863 [Amylocarpus encephaloides]|uniref:SET domain-containing protein n=1 Tax=Amylocarpus encephaloides TaxID=45428 RepID=A0A9P7YI64_9HELO|nr:hypothetical protein BJ875DRAFT_462863 [Amylocarpus encephaloides]